LDVPLSDPAWVAGYRFVPDDDGRPVVAEVHVFPAGRSGRVPPGGLRGRLVRNEVKVSDHLAENWPQVLKGFQEVFGDVLFAQGGPLDRQGLKPAAEEIPVRRRGRPRTTDLELARVAQEYAIRVQGPENRTAARDTATALHYEGKTIKGHLTEARKRGLLTPPPVRGKAGGDLTPKGQAVLAAAGELRVRAHSRARRRSKASGEVVTPQVVTKAAASKGRRKRR
jgi:hypothetical protein